MLYKLLKEVKELDEKSYEMILDTLVQRIYESNGKFEPTAFIEYNLCPLIKKLENKKKIKELVDGC